MKYSKLEKNEEAVSPVIGVILMVAITVILAAVIAAFVFGMGTPTKAPQASLKFSIDSATDTMSMTHGGGDPIVTGNEKISIVWANDTTQFVSVNVGGTNKSANSLSLKDFFGGNETLSPGQTVKNTNLTGVSKDNIVRITILDVPSGQFVSESQVSVT